MDQRTQHQVRTGRNLATAPSSRASARRLQHYRGQQGDQEQLPAEQRPSTAASSVTETRGDQLSAPDHLLCGSVPGLNGNAHRSKHRECGKSGRHQAAFERSGRLIGSRERV